MNAYLVSDAQSLPARADNRIPPIARRPRARWGVAVTAFEAVALLALLLVGGTLALSPVGGYTPPVPSLDVATLPSPADFTPVPSDTSAAGLGAALTSPRQRAWTTAGDPFTALDAVIATLRAAGWAVEDLPTGGFLPSMPHLAQLGRPNAHLLVNAWRPPTDSLTRVVATVQDRKSVV